jgi:PAS domain S-box-containing protein
MEKIIRRAIDQMTVAVTVIDTEGRLLYYNRYAEKILDRKPEYIGQDLRSHHKKPSSNERFNAMMLTFEQGRTEPYSYEASPYEEVILVTLSPIRVDEQFIGCVQVVMLKKEITMFG